MVTELAPSWAFEVERGPDWLFVKVNSPDNGDAEGVPLAQMLWDLMQQHFSRRIVLEMDDLRILRSYVIGQLVQLHKRVCHAGGLMRVTGLSEENYRALVACRLHDRFPRYASRSEAVMGQRPKQPR